MISEFLAVIIFAPALGHFGMDTGVLTTCKDTHAVKMYDIYT